MTSTFILGDCSCELAALPPDSVDAVVTDPPYGLSLFGMSWDYDVPKVEVWRQVLRVLKPGGHLLSFFGTRTYHRGVVAIEDAGFHIRDQLGWLYGSGFPKSHNVSKAIDAAAGAERAKVRDYKPRNPVHVGGGVGGIGDTPSIRAAREVGYIDVAGDIPVTVAAKQWHGWGTTLKPAWEPIVLARKPLVGTVVANVLKLGTGALNLKGCRIETDESLVRPAAGPDAKKFGGSGLGGVGRQTEPGGRWPTNIIHDGSAEVVAAFPGDGNAIRFFYCAKASKRDRDEGLEGFVSNSPAAGWLKNFDPAPRPNMHPTVKPTALMRYLCRLVTPPGGVVLDPFMGSGSTGKAAVLEGFNFIGIERDQNYVAISRARVAHAEAAALSLEGSK